MKSIDLFCASPASTAICTSMDQRAIVRHGPKPLDHRQIQRLGEAPKNRTNTAPCSSQLPIVPARSFHQKPKKTSSAAKKTDSLRRKSSADVDDLPSPTGSSRYLLRDNPFFDFILDSEKVAMFSGRELVKDDNNSSKKMGSDGFPAAAVKSLSTRSYESPVYKLPSNIDDDQAHQKISSARFGDHLSLQKVSSNRQVVELWVSIHCKGCAGKLKKHISRMEGVTSFTIDLETKKVTVIGDVTPLGVLTSISKVKNAQFWPSPTSPSFSSSSNSQR